MKAQTARQPRCPACRSTDVAVTNYQREFFPRKKSVKVTLLSSHCQDCGNEFTTAAQHAENLQRLRARKTEYGGLLLGEEILALRRRYGITQQQAAKIFGKGKIAFSRYENETSYPDASTTKLLKQAILRPEVIKSLADEEQIALPLWETRCEEARRDKVRLVSSIGAADESAQRWAKKELAEGGKRKASIPVSFRASAEGWDTKVFHGAGNDEHFNEPEAGYA